MSAPGVAAAAAADVAGAAAGAGPPPAPARSVAAGGVSTGSVFVKRSDDARANFAEVEIFEADNVARLAERASLKLEWRTTVAYVDLFLVPMASEDAVASREDGAEARVLATPPLSSIKSLLAVSVRDRSCLLARLSGLPAAAPGECARARLAASCCRAGAGRARRTRRRFRWGLCGALTGAYPPLSSRGAHPFAHFQPPQAVAAAAAAAAAAERGWLLALMRARRRRRSGPPTGFARLLSRRALP